VLALEVLYGCQRGDHPRGAHLAGAAEQDGVPQSDAERGVPAPPTGAAARPAQDDGARGGAELRDPGRDCAVRQRVGDRAGPCGVGRAGGVPAGAVRCWRHGDGL
jgi:hypothetical protein